MTTRNFHLGDILSITTGALVSPRHMEGVHDILNFMTGDDLFTHQLIRACQECEPALRRQLPRLAEIEAPDFKANDDSHEVVVNRVQLWLDGLVKQYGEYHEVSPLAAGEHARIDPIAELLQMRSTGSQD